jgi:hypothetical protein
VHPEFHLQPVAGRRVASEDMFKRARFAERFSGPKGLLSGAIQILDLPTFVQK